MTSYSSIGESDVCVNSLFLSEGVLSQSTAHPVAHPSSDLTAARH